MARPRKYSTPLWHPRWWATWLGVALIWLVGQLPWRPLLALGRGMGWLAWRLGTDRRRVAEINLALCFPEKSDAERAALAKAALLSTGEAITEIAGAYNSLHFDARARLTIEGLEHLKASRDAGRGVLLLGMHFNTIDIGARLLGEGAGVRFSVVYRPNDNPALEWMIRHGRRKYVDQYLDRSDMRGLVRTLRAGEVCWYAPDQDYGVRGAIWAPFFGVPAATLVATARIVRMSGADLIPCAHYRLPGGRYLIRFGAPLQDFPSGDDLADCTRVNQVVEQAIAFAPEQYLWVHKRFKHQPGGVSPYGPRKRRRRRR